MKNKNHFEIFYAQITRYKKLINIFAKLTNKDINIRFAFDSILKLDFNLN